MNYIQWWRHKAVVHTDETTSRERLSMNITVKEKEKESVFWIVTDQVNYVDDCYYFVNVVDAMLMTRKMKHFQRPYSQLRPTLN